MDVAETRTRVERQTAGRINEQIELDLRRRLEYFRRHPSEIGSRLRQLDREWDIERALEANASALALTGVTLGMLRGKGWLLLSGAVAGFLFQHAVQGWCPPLPLLRRLGFRTHREIERERYLLRALRGDFVGYDRRAPGTLPPPQDWNGHATEGRSSVS